MTPRELEEQARAQYGQWAEHGMDVVRRLAAEETRRPEWPRTEVDSPRSPADSVIESLPKTLGSKAESASIPTARERGWLVESAPTIDLSDQRLPVAVKDNIDVAGMRVRNGTPGATWRTPSSSSSAWIRLARSGAVCIGKAALHEMAWGVISPEIGNPVDSSRIVGGSSGGSAACVAAGVSPAALGTDTGGSLRIPAALCGVVGFRPTAGLIDTTGVTPLAPEQDTVGPMALDVQTCAAMMETLSGQKLAADSDAPGSIRVGVLAKPGRLDEDVRCGWQWAQRVLSETGADIVEIDSMIFRDAIGVSLTRQLTSSAALYSQLVRAYPQGFGPEARALLTIGDTFQQSLDPINQAASTLTAQTADLFSKHRLDVIVTPTTPCVAPPRDCTSVTINGRTESVSAALPRFTAWASATGIPAISVPVWPKRAGGNGLPTGIQIMAAPNHEHLCVRVARLIEKTLGRTTP